MSRTTTGASWLSLALVLGASAAVAQGKPPVSGVLAGQWLRAEGEPQSVTFSFRAERAGEGRMTVTLGPEGERYTGPYLRPERDDAKERARRIYADFSAPGFERFDIGPAGRSWPRAGIGFEAFRKRYTGGVVASLAGDREGEMRCHLELAEPARGLAGGARGQCQVSDGSTIAIETAEFQRRARPEGE